MLTGAIGTSGVVASSGYGSSATVNGTLTMPTPSQSVVPYQGMAAADYDHNLLLCIVIGVGSAILLI